MFVTEPKRDDDIFFLSSYVFFALKRDKIYSSEITMNSSICSIHLLCFKLCIQLACICTARKTLLEVSETCVHVGNVTFISNFVEFFISTILQHFPELLDAEIYFKMSTYEV